MYTYNRVMKSNLWNMYMLIITQDGESALMMAARWGESEVKIVSLLLEAGADIHLQDKV